MIHQIPFTSLEQYKITIKSLKPSDQVKGLILEYTTMFCDMRNHEPTTYYDFSAEHGIPYEHVFTFVITEADVTLEKFDEIVADMIHDGLIVRVTTGGKKYLHLNIDLDNPFDYQQKAVLNRMILKRIYGDEI